MHDIKDVQARHMHTGASSLYTGLQVVTDLLTGNPIRVRSDNGDLVTLALCA